MVQSLARQSRMSLLLLLFAGAHVVFGGSPEVRTSKGALGGAVLQTRDGKDYFAFTKIPYAKPPLGKLRFMDPQPADSWSGILDASKPNTVCLQNRPTQNSNFLGEEDCLYLNVYTPKLNASLPVIFYVHGGGWSFGNAGPAQMTRYFLDEDVVIVMINYRLGALGFLSTENDILPGNMGLKDMALALKWTKNEIKNFGGNPELITAFGFSTGAASVHYLCSVHKTRDMLKGCISQSGAGGSHFSLRKPGLSKKSAEIIAKVVGCQIEGLIECLHSKSAEEITAAEGHLRFWLGEPMVVFGPVLEAQGNRSLLTNWPISDSKFPWLLGICGSEGAGKSASLVLDGNSSSFNDFYEHKIDYIQRMFSLDKNNTVDAKKIIERFLKNGLIPGMQELYSEGMSAYPALKAAEMHKGAKYFYVFNYTSGPPMWEFRAKRKLNITGVGHGEDNKYYFDISHFYNPKDWPKKEDVKLSKTLIKLWVNFVKFQTPNLKGFEPEWKSFDKEGHYLDIANSGMKMKKYEKMNEIFNFWKSISF